MSETKDLFGSPPYGGLPPYRHGNDTQAAASARIAYIAPNLRERVFAHISAAGPRGRTNNEITKNLNIKLQTVCARVAELRSAGRIHDGGARRKTDSGRDAIVWVAA